MLIDNSIEKENFENIKNICLDKNFIWDYWPIGKIYTDYDKEYPWFYDTKTNNYTNVNDNKDSYSHMGLYNNVVLSQIGLLCKESLEAISKKLNFEIKNIFRIRLGMILGKQNNIINIPHVDDIIPHKVGLLYLTENNGETIIYNETFNRDCSIPERYKQIKKCNGFTIKESVKSVENRFFSFDGSNFHSSMCPTDLGKRITINYNFETY